MSGMRPRPEPIQILLVEDNLGDIELTQEALSESRMANQLHIARDGIEAMEFLRKEGKNKDAPTPDIIFLDLNMPRMNGREVLTQVKQDDELKRIPVVVLTTSDAEEDVLRSYELHANCYVTKPVDFSQFVKVVNAIDGFWFSIVKFPHR